MKKIFASLLAGLVALNAFSQWTTNVGTNRVTSYAFTTSFGTNIGSHPVFNTNAPRTNVAGGFGFQTYYPGTNIASRFGFITAAPPSARNVAAPLFTIYTFGVTNGNTNGMFAYTSTSISNGYSLESSAPIFTSGFSPFNTMRDTCVLKWSSNGVPFYIMTADMQTGAAATNFMPGPLIATSLNGTNWTQQGFVNLLTNNPLGTNLGYIWSPKYSINATNGLVATVGLGPFLAHASTNAFIYDVNPTNFFQWTNPRWINLHAATGGGEPSAGILYYTNGIYYYFDSVGDEVTNSVLAQNGWAVPNGNENSSTWGAQGPTLVFCNGLYYWFTTGPGNIQYITSPDLIHWTPNVFPTAPGLSPLQVFNANGSLVTTYEGSVVINQTLIPRF